MKNFRYARAGATLAAAMMLGGCATIERHPVLTTAVVISAGAIAYGIAEAAQHGASPHALSWGQKLCGGAGCLGGSGSSF